MKVRPWAFILKITTRYSRSTTKKNRPPVMTPPLAKTTIASHQTPDTHEESVLLIFIATKRTLCHYKPPITAAMTFSICINTMGFYI